MLALPGIAAAQNQTASMPVTFSVPGYIAKQGVFVSLFGQNVGAQTSGAGPFVFAYSGNNGSGDTTWTSTLKTLTTNSTGNAPNATIEVHSVRGFPTDGGNLLVSLPNQNIQVSYTSVNATANLFQGVNFANPQGPGIGPGATVTLNQNILAPTIAVTSTDAFPSSGILLLQPPPGTVSTAYNILASYSGTSGNNTFTGVQPFPSGGNFTANQTLTSGGPVILVPTTSGGNLTTQYVSGNKTNGLWDDKLTVGMNIPPISLFPDPSSLSDNQTYTATITLPPYVTGGANTNGILSGVAVIRVGGAVAVTVHDATGTLGAPAVTTAQNIVYGVFEWGLVNAGGGLDFDVSEVDQVGFPFSVNTLGTPPPPPADPVLGVGLLQTRDVLFAGFNQYIAGLPNAAAQTAFTLCEADNAAAPWPVGTRITAPQDITGVVLANPPVASAATASGSSANQPVTAYYAVTAYNSYGESAVSNSLSGATTSSNGSLTVTWHPYPYASGYNIYWSLNETSDGANSLISPVKIGTTAGAGNTTFTDSTPWAHSGNATQVPLSNYTYCPLNRFLDSAIKDFFDYFSASGGNSTFVMDDQATSTKWTGQVQSASMLGNTYRMLMLTGGNGTWGNLFAGKTVYLVEPRFSSNTNNSTLPPPPIVSSSGDVTAINTQQMPFIGNGTIVLDQTGTSWQYNGSGSKTSSGNYTQLSTDPTLAGMSLSPTQSPSAMAFGAQGVFGNFVGNGTTLDVGDAKNVWNSIVTAIVRGLTPRNTGGNWTNIISPTCWSWFPSMLQPQSLTGGNLTANGTYRYTITAYGIMGDTSNATETPQSNPATVYLSGSNASVQLNWTAVNQPGPGSGAATATGFYIYRSQLVSGNWTDAVRLANVSNTGDVPAMNFTDDGTATPTGESPSVVWYRPDTDSNHYAGYFKQMDVSINGLSYGYAYDDKGNTSTNVQMNPAGVTSIVISLNPWASSPGGLPTITVNGTLNPFSTTNGTASAYQTFSASGSNLTGNLSVSTPPSFEISMNGTAYSGMLSLVPANGTVSNTPLYVRIAASAPVGTPSGLILLSSANATTQNLTVSGNVTSGSQAAYASWIANYPSLTGNATLGTADPDGDGFNNNMEFAFDGNPTAMTPHLLNSQSSGGNMTISFVARNTNPPGATYQVQSTTNLVTGFSVDNTVTVIPSSDQTGILLPDQYQRLEFTVPVPASKVFYRIKATIQP